jgi:hypothetical protein
LSSFSTSSRRHRLLFWCRFLIGESFRFSAIRHSLTRLGELAAHPGAYGIIVAHISGKGRFLQPDTLMPRRVALERRESLSQERSCRVP